MHERFDEWMNEWMWWWKNNVMDEWMINGTINFKWHIV